MLVSLCVCIACVSADDALVNVAMQSLTETDLKLEDNLSKVVDTFKVRCMCMCMCVCLCACAASETQRIIA